MSCSYDNCFNKIFFQCNCFNQSKLFCNVHLIDHLNTGGTHIPIPLKASINSESKEVVLSALIKQKQEITTCKSEMLSKFCELIHKFEVILKERLVSLALIETDLDQIILNYRSENEILLDSRLIQTLKMSKDEAIIECSK